MAIGRSSGWTTRRLCAPGWHRHEARPVTDGGRDTMSRARILLAALAAACSSSERPKVAAERALVPALRCALDVPVGTVVTLAEHGATFMTRPGARAPRSFGISARAPDGAGELRQVLAADVSIVYSVHKSEGGSGGEQATLVGALQVGDRQFAVTCEDQGEWPGAPDPTWCLAWLATVRVEG
jgi:hypothetical protein